MVAMSRSPTARAGSRPSTEVSTSREGGDRGDSLRRVSRVRPWIVPAAAATAIAIMFALILLIDVGGLFGGIEAMEATGLAPPAVWFQMFQDRGAAEFLQWGLMGWFVILAATLRGRAGPGDPDLARFWGLIAVFGLLLLFEDAGGVRDTLMHWGDAFLPGGGSGQVVIFVWFGAIAAVLGLALWLYGRAVVSDTGVRAYGLAGVAMFGLAAGGEAFEHVFGWMGPLGWWLVNDVLGAPHILELPQHDMAYLVYLFTDFVVEEPLELLGIAFLVAAVLAHVRTSARAEPR